MAKRRRRGRPVDGILLLDKPQGLTSNQALQKVKSLFRAAKAGHTGSLDPLATGLLPICFGEATKVSAFLLDADKHYHLVARLGQTTDTGDAEGRMLEEKAVKSYSSRKLEKVLKGFDGPIKQIPPMYSAVKQQGQPLYKLARQGLEVEREPREITIHRLSLLDQGSDWLELEVHCSKGTYVRTLVEDIGAELGCGAHVIALRRTGVGPWTDHEMVSLELIEALASEGMEGLDALLEPIDAALSYWPAVELHEDLCFYLRQGQAVQVPGAPSNGYLRLYRSSGEFFGMGLIQDDGRVAPKRLIAGRGG